MRNELRLCNFCLHTLTFQSVEIYTRVQKTAFHPVKDLIFWITTKFIKKTDQIDSIDQSKNPIVNKSPSTLASTSYRWVPLETRDITTKKSSMFFELKILPFSWLGFFDSKILALLTKWDLVLKKLIKNYRKRPETRPSTNGKLFWT